MLTGDKCSPAVERYWNVVGRPDLLFSPRNLHGSSAFAGGSPRLSRD
jgi:hypothetical protein